MSYDNAMIEWRAANRRYTMTALDNVRRALQRYVWFLNGEEGVEGEVESLDAIAAAMSAPPMLERLCVLFNLMPAERDLLLLCAGRDLDGRFDRLLAGAQRNLDAPYPTLRLFLEICPEAGREILAPNGRLCRWGLIESDPGPTISTRPLRVSERVLNYLDGVDAPDEMLHALLHLRSLPPADRTSMLPAHLSLAEDLGELLTYAVEQGRQLTVQLCGDEHEGKHAIVAAAAVELHMRPYIVSASSLPVTAADMDRVICQWDLEAFLSNSLLVLDCQELGSPDASPAARMLVDHMGELLIVICRDPFRSGRATARLDVRKPAVGDQIILWRKAIGEIAAGLEPEIEAVASQFNFGTGDIGAVGSLVAARAAYDASSDPAKLLWDTCRSQARPKLDDLAARIEPRSGWDDLVLPELQLRIIREIAAHVRQRTKVYDEWGLAAKGSRGLGISALFAGPSGTGKTLAAEVIAAELRLDLYHIDLSQIVSKYIGETEKNLRRIFDAAEEAGAVLLFDEADALFGKRSEVKDSHDRHANIEVSYLLQRMESYRGLAILTTNMKQALDTAFLRRIRFVVDFPFPDVAHRAEIWRRVYPAGVPCDGLDHTKLAKLNVAGGNIRNIALNAAFLAADEDEPVRMRHIFRAVRSEYLKLEKQLTDAEIKEWV